MKQARLLLLCSFFLTGSLSAEINSTSLNQETWANWGRRLERAYTDIKPRKMPGRAMGILVPADTRTDLLPLAAFGYDVLSAGKLKTVVILMPAPPQLTQEGLVMPSLEFLDTSIGSFAIDTFLMSELKVESLPTSTDNEIFYPSVPPILEAQLAALKYVLGAKISSTKILPIFVRLNDVNSQVKDIAPIIAEKIKDNDMVNDVTFLVVGDLSRTASETVLVASDSGMLNALRNLDVDALIEQGGRQFSEGSVSHPALSTLALGVLTLKWLGADHGEVLAYAHSSQLVLTKNKKVLTSYASIGFASGPPYPTKVPHVKRDKLEETFDEMLRSDLLAVVRQTATSVIDPTAAKPPALTSKIAGKPWPVYISIYGPDGKLAGQAGSHLAVGPLEESVRRFAVEAVQALGPVTKEAFKNHVVDVSIPYGFYRISRPEELVPFLNGIIVHRNHKKSAFHPDSWRRYPDPHQLLASISSELGLMPWAYATRQAELETFRVLAFNEKEPFQSFESPKKKKQKEKQKPLDGLEDGDDGGGGDSFSF